MEIQSSEVEEIDFNPDLFNDIYFHLEKDFNNEDLRYIFLYGGSSASKTFTVVQKIIVSMLNGPDENSLVLRKYAVDIRDSIYSDFKNIINDWGLQEYFVIQQNFILCSTGSFVRFRGLDDSEKIKGISSFKRVILEEISQFDEIDFKQIRKRLRGRANQQIIGIFNPISEEHWLKKNLFDTENLKEVETGTNISGKWINKKGNFVVYKLTYLNNKYIVGPNFVDKHTIDDFEKDKETDYAYYQIYALGNWGKLRTGGEFWKDFNANTHVGKYPWRENLPIHLSWDENVNPYLTCLVWQIEIKDGKKFAWQIDEICLEDPRNRVKHVCAEFNKRYPTERVSGLFIYGDRTSVKEDTLKEKGENFFTEIELLLKDYKPTRRLQSVNPSVVQSGKFINEIYARNEGNIAIGIDQRCKKSLFDYLYALEDSDGALNKTKKKNKVTGVMYEEFGHASDAKRYLLTTAFHFEYLDYKSGKKGVKVITGKNVSKNGY
jgi:phage terminase large subunit